MNIKFICNAETVTLFSFELTIYLLWIFESKKEMRRNCYSYHDFQTLMWVMPTEIIVFFFFSYLFFLFIYTKLAYVRKTGIESSTFYQSLSGYARNIWFTWVYCISFCIALCKKLLFTTPKILRKTFVTFQSTILTTSQFFTRKASLNVLQVWEWTYHFCRSAVLTKRFQYYRVRLFPTFIRVCGIYLKNMKNSSFLLTKVKTLISQFNDITSI